MLIYEEYKRRILNDVAIAERDYVEDAEALLTFYLSRLIVGDLMDWKNPRILTEDEYNEKMKT